MPSVSLTPIVSADDGEFNVRGVYFNNTNTEIQIKKWAGDDDDGPDDIRAVVRFPSTELGDKRIDSATLTFTASRANVSSTWNLEVYGYFEATHTAPTSNAEARGKYFTIERSAFTWPNGLQAGSPVSVDVTDIVNVLVNKGNYDNQGILLGIRRTNNGADNSLYFASTENATYDPVTLDVDYTDLPTANHTFRVLADADDGRFDKANGAFVNTGSIISLSQHPGDDDDAPDNDRLFRRFNDSGGTDISGLTVNRAYMKVSNTLGGLGFGGVLIDIHAADQDDQTPPANFTEGNAIVETTAKTSQAMSSSTLYLIDVTAVVNEVLARPGYVPGTGLMIIMKHAAALASMQTDSAVDDPAIELDLQTVLPAATGITGGRMPMIIG